MGDISKPEDIFAKKEDGSQDTIHLNDLGNYFVALVHYAVIKQESPLGLAHELVALDGREYQAPSKELAQLMQTITWQTVNSIKYTGVTSTAVQK